MHYQTSHQTLKHNYCYDVPELIYDAEQLQIEYRRIVENLSVTRAHLHLTHRDGCIDQLYGDGERYFEIVDGAVISDNHYVHINDFVKGTIFEQVINDVRQLYPVTKCKFVKLKSNFMYRVHTDLYDHIHLPITGSTFGAIFDCKSTDEVHWFDTDGKLRYCRTNNVPHTFFNCPDDSTQERTTLMMTIARNFPSNFKTKIDGIRLNVV